MLSIDFVKIQSMEAFDLRVPKLAILIVNFKRQTLDLSLALTIEKKLRLSYNSIQVNNEALNSC